MNFASNPKRDHINASLFKFAQRLLEENGLEPNQVRWSLSRNPSEEGALRIGYKLKSLDMFEGQIEANCQKYYVTYEPLKAYTVIGATNIHHAFNKATKEFKGKYTKIVKAKTNSTPDNDWEFLSVKEFAALLSKVKI